MRKETNTYINMSRFQKERDVYNSPLPPMRGLHMLAPLEDPMLFPLQNDYQLYDRMPGMAGAPAIPTDDPPPYCSFEEETTTLQNFTEST